MATYNITKSDGTAGPGIPDAASPDTQTDLQLVGQNAVSYGLDVATSFYWLLENFADVSAPSSGAARTRGQLWYDITTGDETLNVYNGATWDQIANTNRGSSAVTSTLRWDDAANKWSEDVRVTIDGSGTLGLVGPTPGNSVAISHDDTDLNIVGTSTVDINVTSGITAVNLPAITLTTVLDETYGGTGQTTFTTGDVLYASGANTLSKLAVGTNGDVLTLAAGVPSWVAAGAGVTALTTLTDVDTSGVITGSLMYKTGTDWTDTPGLTWNVIAGNLSATRFGNILEANLIDRAAPGTISGAATFTNNVTLSTANLDLQDNDQILFGTSDDVAIDFDSADLVITANSAVDLNITGFTGRVHSTTEIVATAGPGGAQLRAVASNSNTTTAEAYVSAYTLAEAQELLRVGSVSGSAFTEVRSLVQDLNLYATNTLALALTDTTSTMNQAGSPAMQWRAVTGSNISTSASVYDDGSQARNVGYNETPESVVSSARTIDVDDIGKFLTRSASTSRIITLDLDSDIPVGGSLVVHNDHITGTLTIVEGTITNLEWVDGSGAAPSTGTRTLAYNGVATLRKKSTTLWQIWGNGIS